MEQAQLRTLSSRSHTSDSLLSPRRLRQRGPSRSLGHLPRCPAEGEAGSFGPGAPVPPCSVPVPGPAPAAQAVFANALVIVGNEGIVKGRIVDWLVKSWIY